MKVLIVGAGAREHAIAWKLKKDGKVKKIFSAPINIGIKEIGQCINIDVLDFENLVNFTKNEKIDMAIVSQDNPLVMGLVDEFEKSGIRTFGPNKNAAMIEGSKVFSKKFMKKYKIPTADFKVFDEKNNAFKYIEQMRKFPIVIKADGLAYGKGVIIANNILEANCALNDIMEKKIFAGSGNKVVIEEFLMGAEVSALAFTDGKTIKVMPKVRDYKKSMDGNVGLNTGGMGAFSPNEPYEPNFYKECMEKIFIPTINGLKQERRKFKGVIYFGLIETTNGVKVIEYNSRFGDPEAEVLLPKLKTDLYDIFDAIIDERLNEIDIEWQNAATVCVVAASQGYPKKFDVGYEVFGLESIDDKNCIVFHSGTKLSSEGKVLTSGGRVLAVTALGSSVSDAAEKAYNNIKNIKFENMYYRSDIGS